MMNGEGTSSVESGSAQKGEHIVQVQVDLSEFFVNQYGGWAAFRSSDLSADWCYTIGNQPAQNKYEHGPKWIRFFFPTAGSVYPQWTLDPSCTPDGHFYNQASLYGPGPGPTPPQKGFKSDYFRTNSELVKVTFYVKQTDGRFVLTASYNGIDPTQHRLETDE